MHVDIVRVRHVHAHEAESIEVPGVLAEANVEKLRFQPIDGVRIDFLSVGLGQHPDMLARQIFRVLAQLGDQVLEGHALGHFPEREEIETLDLGGYARCRTFDAAHDDAALERNAALVNSLQLHGRYVDHDIAVGQPVCDELLHPL